MDCYTSSEGCTTSSSSSSESSDGTLIVSSWSLMDVDVVPASIGSVLSEPSTSYLQVNYLPNDCLLLIFEKFSLSELVRIRGCCTRWKWLIETALFSRRRSLKIFYGERELIDYYCLLNENYLLVEDSDFVKLAPLPRSVRTDGTVIRLPGGRRFPKFIIAHDVDDHLFLKPRVALTKELCYWLARLFPNIENLLCWNLLFSNDRSYIHLLRIWRTQLRFLGLFKVSIFWNTFWEFVRVELSNLRHLALGSILGCSASSSLRVLPYLEKISLFRCVPGGLLNKIGRNIRGVNLYCSYNFNHRLERLIKDKSYLKRALTTLVLKNVDAPTLVLVCDQLKGLAFLDLEADPNAQLNLRQIGTKVSQLKYLKTLSLRHSKPKDLFDPTTMLAYFNHNLPAVNPVKDLRLYFSLTLGDDTQHHLAIIRNIFPQTVDLLLDVDKLIGVWHESENHQASGTHSASGIHHSSQQSTGSRQSIDERPCLICLHQARQTALRMFRFIYEDRRVQLFTGQQAIREFLQEVIDDQKDADYCMSSDESSVEYDTSDDEVVVEDDMLDSDD